MVTGPETQVYSILELVRNMSFYIIMELGEPAWSVLPMVG